MAVTTVTSIGYMEVHPLSPAGRTFTMGVIVLGVTGLGIWWALITALIVELDLGGALRRRRKMKQLEQLADHYVICGAGRVGRMALREMQRAGVPVVVIEKDVDRANDLEEEHPSLLVLNADAVKERVLDEAHIAFVPGEAFGDTCVNSLRISFSASMEKIEEAFERMIPWLSQQRL